MASPFASHTTSDPIPLPFDRGHWIQVRRLTGKECERAQEEHRGNLTSARSWAATFRRMLEQGTAKDPEVLKTLRDPLTGYDRYALARSGLVAWSYPQSIKPVRAQPEILNTDGSLQQAAVPAYDAIEDLDDEAVDFIATEVLRLTKPALFAATEEDAAAAQRELHAAAPVA